MSSYVLVGVTRGLGFEFMRQISENPDNTIFAIVRNKTLGDSKVAELGRKNITVLEADTLDPVALKNAADYVSSKTDGKLDYIITSAALQDISCLYGFDELSKDPAALEKDLLEHYRVNAIGPIHLFNTFMPLILKGKAKKVIAISTGGADTEMTLIPDMYQATSYMMSKAALNMAVAKFSALYRKEGVLVMAICPGAVDTGSLNIKTEEEGKLAMALFGKFKEYSPTFAGPTPAPEAAASVLKLVNKATVDGGYAGVFISHTEKKPYL